MENGGLAGTVSTEEKGEWSDWDFDSVANSLKVFDDDFGDRHGGVGRL